MWHCQTIFKWTPVVLIPKRNSRLIFKIYRLMSQIAIPHHMRPVLQRVHRTPLQVMMRAHLFWSFATFESPSETEAWPDRTSARQWQVNTISDQSTSDAIQSITEGCIYHAFISQPQLSHYIKCIYIYIYTHISGCFKIAALYDRYGFYNNTIIVRS